MGGIIAISFRHQAEEPIVTDFLLRDLDPHVLGQLRRRAEEHGRSLQAEIHDTLKRSVRLSKAESIAMLKELHRRLPSSTRDSTEDIRADRDSR
jgi:plasmid stability protein